MNYYLNKESVFITASRSYILTLCVTVLHTWVRTLRCSRCCLCQESRRPSWFPRVSLRTGRTTGRTSCSWMTPELETQTRRRRTITSEQQRAQTTAESRPGLGMSWGVNPFWKIKITMWLLSRWEIFQPYFLFLISLNQQTQVSTYTDMMSETPVSLRFHHHSVEYIYIYIYIFTRWRRYWRCVCIAREIHVNKPWQSLMAFSMASAERMELSDIFVL